MPQQCLIKYSESDVLLDLELIVVENICADLVDEEPGEMLVGRCSNVALQLQLRILISFTLVAHVTRKPSRTVLSFPDMLLYAML